MRRCLIAMVLVGCGVEGAAREEPALAPAPPGAPELEGDAPAASAAWPDDVTSLREQLDAFTTADACRAELRRRTPTAVAEGLSDLRYEAFFDDVCAGLAAVASGSVEGCDAIGPSPTRAGCRTRLALVHARPEACPDDRVMTGPEPVCVAWASRDRALCRAAALPDAIRCRAVLDDSAEGCRGLPAGDRGRCTAEVARYASAITGDRSERELAAARMELELRSDTGDPETLERDVLERGVRLRVDGCRARVALEHAHGEGSLPLGIGRREGTFRLEIAFPVGAELPLAIPLDGRDAVLTVRSPARGGLSSIAGATGTVTLSTLELERGGTLEGTVAGTLRSGQDTIRVRGGFATFLRDLDPISAACRRDDAP